MAGRNFPPSRLSRLESLRSLARRLRWWRKFNSLSAHVLHWRHIVWSCERRERGLQDTGGGSTTVSANGNFSLSTRVADSAIYAVTVETQPTGQTGTVTAGSALSVVRT